ncbi:MAG: hypothetical protein RLZZ350_2123 [Verrucomicrobiota bacterium]
MRAREDEPFSERTILIGWFGYFAVMALARLALGGGVELDEAEQLVMTQQWCWGYDVQPPLYTWLQKLFFTAGGVNLATVVVLKELLLASVGAVVFRAVKAMDGSSTVAAAAMLSFFLLPQFVWESQRDQTHSVLATLCAATTLWLAVRLARKNSATNFAAFGLVAALGCLSKYNYAIFLGALGLAFVSLKDFRHVWFTRRAFWAAAVFAVVAWPHAEWARAHTAIVLSRASQVQVQGVGLGRGWAQSFGSLVAAVAAFSGLAVVVYFILFVRATVTVAATADLEKHRRFVRRILALGGALCLAMVVGGQARFKDRWMQPLLFLTPVFLALVVAEKLAGQPWRRLRWVTGGVAVAVAIVLSVLPFWAAAAGHERYLNPDYARLAAELRARGFSSGLIVAADRKLGGNLRLNFPDCEIRGVNFPELTPPARDVPGVVVWSAATDGQLAPPPLLVQVVRELRGVDLAALAPVTVVTIPREHTAQKPMTFAFITLPATQGKR